ncbi:MAG: (2Fe-2S) ferredoxin domain-containing protein [Spirochaetaceae bacterium]|nr:MAG: (2Fe-2S) ferredoxin domain-containing protein [Spirochaetaceae bacterium]
MGSSCFARGNRANLELLESFLETNDLRQAIDLTGSRCEQCCPRGPNIRIGETSYHGVDEGSLLDLLEALAAGPEEV